MPTTLADLETLHKVMKDTSKLSLSDFEELMRDAPPKVVKYLKSKKRVANKRQLAIAKRKRGVRAAKRAKTAHSGQDRSNNFGIFYLEIKEAAAAYFERVKNGKQAFAILGTSTKAPWRIEFEVDADLADKVSLCKDPDQFKKLYEEHRDHFLQCARSINDMSLRKLAQEVNNGALLTALFKRLVVPRHVKHDDLVEALGTSKSTSERLRGAYALVSKFNLLLYTGATYTELHKWRNDLLDRFKKNPAERRWWRGGGLTYGETAPAKDFDKEKDMAFDNYIYPYSNENISGRQADEDELKNPELHVADVEGMDQPDGDSGEDESIDLVSDSDLLDELPAALENLELARPAALET